MSALSVRMPRLLLAVGVAAVLWHILACIESPMSFSPDGDLAFVVVDPYEMENNSEWLLAETRTYRLMVLGRGGELREIERTSSHQISAPAYSPDGKQIAYLRVPLLTRPDWERIRSLLEERFYRRKRMQAESGDGAWFHFAPGGLVESEARAPGWESLGLSLREHLPFEIDPPDGGLIPVELVVRTANGEPLGAFRFDVPFPFPPLHEGKDEFDAGEYAAMYVNNYVLNRPAYEPNGEWVYCLVNFQAVAVNVVTGEVRRLEMPSAGVRLSPDGKTLVSLGEKSLAFVQTDGSRVVYVRPAQEPFPFGGFHWVDATTLAVLGKSGIDYYSSDGALDRPAAHSRLEGKTDEGSLTLSPDGRYLAIAGPERVSFFTTDGDVLGVAEAPDGHLLAQPIFAPDSKRVALKLIGNEKGKRMHTQAIVFFDTSGEELSRVPIPRVESAAEPREEKP